MLRSDLYFRIIETLETHICCLRFIYDLLIICVISKLRKLGFAVLYRGTWRGREGELHVTRSFAGRSPPVRNFYVFDIDRPFHSC